VSITFRRAVWVLATPFVGAAHRLGWCSYKWVNVCLGARKPDGFDPLWQHEWYGAPIPRLPDEVILSGIGYTLQSHEGLVVFSCNWAASRITFERDQHNPLEDLWYVRVFGNVPASHVMLAYRWVSALFGGSFERKAELAA